MKHCFFALIILTILTSTALSKTSISPGDACVDLDGCDCHNPLSIDVANRYINKKEVVECKFTSLCYENASGVNCQDSDAADIECEHYNACPTSLIGNYEDAFPEYEMTRHFVVVGKNKYMNAVGLKELNPRLNMNEELFMKELKDGTLKNKPEDLNTVYECPIDDTIDGCMLSWGYIDEQTIIAQNKKLKFISEEDRLRLQEVNGEIVMDPNNSGAYTLPVLQEDTIKSVTVKEVEISRTDDPFRLKNMALEFKYRFGIFIPKGARASRSDGMLELDYDDGASWKCPEFDENLIENKTDEMQSYIEKDPILKKNEEIQKSLIAKHAALFERVCICNASLDFCPNSKKENSQFCHLLGPEPYCHSKDVVSLTKGQPCTDFYGCRCNTNENRGEKESTLALVSVLAKQKAKRLFSKMKSLVSSKQPVSTIEDKPSEQAKVNGDATQGQPSADATEDKPIKLEDLKKEIRNRTKFEIIRKNFICGDDRFNVGIAERECADEFCYCSELERAKRDAKCASAVKDEENRLKIGEVCKAENGCFCHNIGMIGVTCAKNEICQGPNLIANFIMNSIVMTAQKKIPFASLDIPKLQIMTCRRDKNAFKFWKCTLDRGCFCGYSAISCKKDMFCRLSKAKNLCMEKETSAAFEFREVANGFKNRISNFVAKALNKHIKSDGNESNNKRVNVVL
jgi:hypothetical protein